MDECERALLLVIHNADEHPSRMSFRIQFLYIREVFQGLRVFEGVAIQDGLSLDDLLDGQLDLLHVQGIGDVRHGDDLGRHVAR